MKRFFLLTILDIFLFQQSRFSFSPELAFRPSRLIWILKPLHSIDMEPKEAFRRFFEAEWPLAESNGAYGAGCFGSWTVDETSRPAYSYEIDQIRDSRAEYRVSEGVSRDHWHLVGNDRIVATAHNGGYVQVYDWSRGGKLLNPWKPQTDDYAGGFVFVEAGGEILSTLWDSLPRNAVQSRLFGEGYAEKVTRWEGFEVCERTEAPLGDDAVLLRTIRLTNNNEVARTVSITECWGYALECLLPMPLAMPPWRRFFQWRRRRWDRRFEVRTHWDADCRVLSAHSVFRGPAPTARREERCLRDYFPKTFFLASLDPLEEGFRGYCTD